MNASNICKAQPKLCIGNHSTSDHKWGFGRLFKCILWISYLLNQQLYYVLTYVPISIRSNNSILIASNLLFARTVMQIRRYAWGLSIRIHIVAEINGTRVFFNASYWKCVKPYWYCLIKNFQFPAIIDFKVVS